MPKSFRSLACTRGMCTAAGATTTSAAWTHCHLERFMYRKVHILRFKQSMHPLLNAPSVHCCPKCENSSRLAEALAHQRHRYLAHHQRLLHPQELQRFSRYRSASPHAFLSTCASKMWTRSRWFSQSAAVIGPYKSLTHFQLPPAPTNTRHTSFKTRLCAGRDRHGVQWFVSPHPRRTFARPLVAFRNVDSMLCAQLAINGT